MSHILENILQMIFATVHSFSLPAWRPDLVGGTATSLYNEALEMIAIWTFEQAAATFAYQHFSPNLCARVQYHDQHQLHILHHHSSPINLQSPTPHLQVRGLRLHHSVGFMSMYDHYFHFHVLAVQYNTEILCYRQTAKRLARRQRVQCSAMRR